MSQPPKCLQDVLDKFGYGWSQYRTVLLAQSIWAADNAELLMLSAVTQALRKEWDLDASQRGALVTCLFLGMGIGNGISGSFTDVHGRRPSVVASYLLVFILSIISTFAFSFLSLSILRTILGIALGIAQPASVTLAMEISPTSGKLYSNNFGNIMFAIGEIYSASILYFIDSSMQHLNWRFLVGVGAIPSGVMAILSYKWLRESPAFLAVNGRKDEALQILESVRDENGFAPSESVDFQEDETVVAEETNRYELVFGRRQLPVTLILCMSICSQNFALFGGLYSFAQILPDVESDSGMSPAANLILGAAMQIPGCIACYLIMKRIPVKRAVQLCLLGAILSSAIFNYAAEGVLHGELGGRRSASWGMMQAGYLGMKFCSIGMILANLEYVYQSFQTQARGTGSGICYMAGRLAGLASPLIYEWATEYTGNKLAFLYFFIVFGACTLSLQTFLPLTGGDSVHKDETSPLCA